MTRPQATGRGAGAQATLERQRRIQREQDHADRERADAEPAPSAPPRAGVRDQPRDMPAQHLEKPGLESELELAPRFMAPQYEGRRKLRDRVALITGDVKDGNFCRQAVQRTIDELGQLDLLVNNAAFQEHADSIEDITEERLHETLDTNVKGYFNMVRAALPHLPQGGAIINTGSVVGLRGASHLLDYAASKGAVHAFTKSLAQNLIHKGIRVNAVAPGPVWTPLNPADAPAERVAEFGRNTDMQRAAQPEEISPAYVFLASSVMSGYITGIVLPITGSVGAI